MKSLIGLIKCVLADASTWCGAHTFRDGITISDRVEHEGLSFLTITLPRFGADFEKGLSQGFVDSQLFLGFKRQKESALPRFLGGLLSLVFDTKGVLRDNPCIDSIRFIREITLMHKKIELPCSTERERAAYERFITCEREVSSFVLHDGNSLHDCYSRVSDLLWSNALSGINSAIGEQGLIPRHGPGATAERISANAKYRIRTWHRRLEQFFPSDQYVIPNWNYIEELEKIDFTEPDAEKPVRVISVPKTLKTPRIIGIEPVCQQYCQQAVLEVLAPVIETHKLLCGSINITDQEVNQELALKSSKNQAFATLDLSEASDRVSKVLVENMLKTVPDLLGAVMACRTTSAALPNGVIINNMGKFASMGSALCFPIEAMVFLTILVSGMITELNMPVSLKSIVKCTKRIKVYGDDIIVPVDLAPAMCATLESFGLKVNTAKSFWTGKFRESCGMDAYDGHRVTPVYVRRMPPSTLLDVDEILSWVSLGNQLYEQGLWQSTAYVRELVGRIATIPHAPKKSSIIAWENYNESFRSPKSCPNLQVPLIWGLCVEEKARKSVLDGSAALMKFFLKRGDKPFHDEKHLQRSGRPVSITLKYRWLPAY